VAYDFDLPDDDDAPEQDDLAARLKQAKADHADAERRLTELQAKHAAAGSGPAAGKAPTGPAEVDLDALLAKVSDRSRSWPEIEAELVAQGFTGKGPQPSQRGLRAG
jgi:hypothetical protein